MLSYHVRPDITNVEELLNGSDIQTFLQTDDKVVTLTEWTPKQRGGQSVQSHNLRQADNDTLVFKMALRTAIYYYAMIAMGLFLIVLPIISPLLHLSGKSNPLILVAVGLLFGGIGVYLLRITKKKISLSKNKPAIWEGEINPASAINPNTIKGYHSLKALHAVQLLQEYVSSYDDGKDNSYFSYEINLILSDGTRIHLVDHGNTKMALRQAQQVAEFFNVVLWKVVWAEDGTGTNRLMIKSIQFLKLALFIVVLGVAAFFAWNMYKGTQEIEAKKVAIEALSPVEYAKHNAKISKELFSLMKSRKVNFPRLKQLEREGVDLNTKDEKGRTPLFYAVQTKNGDYIRHLIYKGANVDVRDNDNVSLKDMLDPIKDKLLYYTLVDAELSADARRRNKRVIGITRTFDKAGKVSHLEVNER